VGPFSSGILLHDRDLPFFKCHEVHACDVSCATLSRTATAGTSNALNLAADICASYYHPDTLDGWFAR
jgi:hypothetical protein